MSARYAVYFAPARDSPWRRFGAHWLGRDEHDSTALPQTLLETISAEELTRITHEPRRYGFHATLKAPFRLADGYDDTDLVARLGALALTLQPVALGPLRPAFLGDFVALIPESPPAALDSLAAACVTELDDLRAPLQSAELARRRVDWLDARHAELLARYGYPYVLERFRLHFTLTGPVDEAVAKRVERAVASDTARLNAEAPLWLDRLCLFVEPTPNAPFHRIIDLTLSA